jgi:hypothetical protein
MQNIKNVFVLAAGERMQGSSCEMIIWSLFHLIFFDVDGIGGISRHFVYSLGSC